MGQFISSETYKTFAEVIQRMHRFNTDDPTNVAYSFATLEKNGSYTFYPRIENCYGELRKYQDTHGFEECLQDEDRPHDLRSPFPKTGSPCAVGLAFNYGYYQRDKPEVSEDFVAAARHLFSNESPWLRGFKGSEFLEWSKDNKGVVIKTGDVEPTVMINLFKNLQELYNEGSDEKSKLFLASIKAGLTIPEASACLVGMKYPLSSIQSNAGYTNPAVINFKRMKSQDPLVLTKGKDGLLLSHRADYSRRYMHMPFGVFMSPLEDEDEYLEDGEESSSSPQYFNPKEIPFGINLPKVLSQRGINKFKTVEEMVTIVKEVLNGQ